VLLITKNEHLVDLSNEKFKALEPQQFEISTEKLVCQRNIFNI